VVLWVVAGVSLLLALASLLRVRRLSRTLEALSQSYWELRYDYTRLRSQVARLDPDQAEPETPPPAPPGESVTFVPLSSIKRKAQPGPPDPGEQSSHGQ
jgi:hypothetical protein